ncbi:hypothetical protein LCGC14_1399570 [marine sediment metagenome]|uniref:Uncharacterized protein n=1 Tax=marine sediment metagenome TaxID=412755 RepID=A0A0F9MD14_9ZZZZ
MYKKMRYFEDWKFGVPVVVCFDGARVYEDELIYLVHENTNWFIVLRFEKGRQKIRRCLTPHAMEKDKYSYVPVPHSIDLHDSPIKPRFPVCRNRRYTVYCNKGSRMAHMAVEPTDNVTEIKELRGAKCSAKT